MARTLSGGMGALKKHHLGRSFLRDDAFWKGVASVFNLAGQFTPLYYGRDPEKADRAALRSDWEAVGRDMERVMRRFEQEHAKELTHARRAVRDAQSATKETGASNGDR